MKDYYYILGIKQTAPIDEVKKAYRKLSLKFHPDKNEGDDFFTERFKEIQEAYETLIDISKRKKYDEEFINNNSSKNQQNNGSNFNPEIQYFKSNKPNFEYDEEITFSWKTINADKVIIRPFGEVQPIGQKTYKIKEFKKAELTFELIAENTNIGRLTRVTLNLRNQTYFELYNHFKTLIELNKSNENTESKKQPSYSSRQKTKEESQNGKLSLLNIIIGWTIFFFFIVLIFILLK